MKSKIKALEKYREEEKKVFCNLCGIEIKKDYGKIKILTSDTSHRYKGSNIPFRNHYGLTCCPKCFKHMINGIQKTILSSYDNKKSKD